MRRITRPNVLLIYTDQQRWDSLGCYGNKLAKTPNIDKLASNGARLNSFYVQNPVCMPSRMSFLTGRYPSSLGIGINGIPLYDSAVPVNQLLKPYGYHTAQIGKLHFQPHSRREHSNPHPTYGFDTFILSDEPGCYDDAYIKWVEAIDPSMVEKVRTSLPLAALQYGMKSYSDKPRNTHEPYIFEGDEDLTHSAFVASETCRFLEQAREEPFFAIAGFYAPHTPVNPPKRFVDMYNPKDMPLPKMGESEEYAPGLKDVSKEEWQEIAAYYLALVSHVDDCVGRILESLERSGKKDNTIVIFTTDHGEYLGDHGRVQKGAPGHDCIMRVPFIINYPAQIEGGKAYEQMVEAVDIVPTILDYCGIQTPNYVQGLSIKKLLDGDVSWHREEVFAERFVPNEIREAVIRTKEYKYFMNSKQQEILYDMKMDPYELNNVINNEDYKEVVSEMRRRMIQRLFLAANNSHERIAQY